MTGTPDQAAKLIETHQDIGKVEIKLDKLMIVTLKKGVDDYSFLPTLLVTAGHKITLFREEELNLETAFMALTKGITS